MRSATHANRRCFHEAYRSGVHGWEALDRHAAGEGGPRVVPGKSGGGKAALLSGAHPALMWLHGQLAHWPDRPCLRLRKRSAHAGSLCPTEFRLC